LLFARRGFFIKKFTVFYIKGKRERKGKAEDENENEKREDGNIISPWV
jgi:hypothetical protein